GGCRTRSFTQGGGGHRAERWRRGRHRPRLPGHQVATTTAGSQPTAMIGDQLPCRTAWTIELIATTATAKPVITYINRAHELMTVLRSVKHPCHRQANFTPYTCQP